MSGVRVVGDLAEMARKVVEAADARAVDEGLRRALDLMLGLEAVGLLPRGQQMILDREALPFEQVLGFQAVGAGVLRHDHPIEDGLAGSHLRHLTPPH
jgi:hypothetical protein